MAERYFTPERMAEPAPAIRRVAGELVARLDVPGAVDAVELGSLFAVRAQSAWLGRPAEREAELLTWMADNHAATRSRNPSRTAAVARRFEAIIRSLLAERREGDDASRDITAEPMREQVAGRALRNEEIVSILRNWTGGDLGSMALCAGVVLGYLADHLRLQEQPRAGVPDR